MTGWRIGYCGGPKEIITAMTTIQGQSTSNASSISQKAAVAALNGDQQCVAEMNRAFKERHDFAGRRAQHPAGRLLPARRRHVLRLCRRPRRHAQPGHARRQRILRVPDQQGAASPWSPAPALVRRATCACRSPAAWRRSRRPSSACARCCRRRPRPRRPDPQPGEPHRRPLGLRPFTLQCEVRGCLTDSGRHTAFERWCSRRCFWWDGGRGLRPRGRPARHRQ